MLVFFFPETPSQIVVGLLLAFVSTCIYARHKPFVQSEDDFVAYVASCQIFFIMLSALLSLISSDKYTNEEADPGDLYSEVHFGWLMIGVSLVAPVIATVMAFREWLSRLWEVPAQLREASEPTQAATPNQTEIEMCSVSAGARSGADVSNRVSELGVTNPIRQSV